MNESLFEQVDEYLQCQNEQNEYLLDCIQFIWQYLFHSCEFSKRFLFKNESKHEYFAFNNLLIDKIDDILSKIINKFSFFIQNASKSTHFEF